jgi:hypothetical protein
MKYSALIAVLSLLTMFSCQKEVIVPVSQDTEEVFNTRGSTRNPTNGEGGGENGSVTDPDNETEDDKIRSKKKKASN